MKIKLNNILIPWRAGSSDTESWERFLVLSSDTKQKYNDCNKDYCSGYRDDYVEPQVKVGASRYATDFLGIPANQMTMKINSLVKKTKQVGL